MLSRSSAGTKVPQHPWPLADLPAPARAMLFASASERRFQADEVLYLAGSPAHALYLVLEGRVRLLRGHGGRAIFIHDEEAGGALGEIPLFEGTTYPATAIAAEATRCLVLPREAILAAIHNNPDLALAILARLASRVRFLVDKLDSTANHSTLRRLAELILARAESAHGKSFTLGATQQHAAEEIGTVRELVVRGLRTLRDRGAIESRGGGRYFVSNEALLNEIATAGQ